MRENVIKVKNSGQAGYLPQCESIRGMAILLVFWFHYLGTLQGYAPHPDMPFGLSLLYGGNTGVTLFFLLSGFLLTRPFFQGAPRRFDKFLVRRALRILPMFYLAVLVGALLNNQWLGALKSMFFYDIDLTTLWPMGSVWWSLVVEVQFYLLLPLLVWLADRPAWRWLLLALLVAAIWAYLQIRNAAPQDLNPLRGSLIGRWPVFLLGAALAWFQVNKAEKLKVAVQERQWIGLILLAASLGALVMLCDYRIRHLGMFAHVYFFDHYFFEGLAWAGFMFTLLNFRFAGYRLFVNPLLHNLGVWSYSIYLLHSAVIFYALKRYNFYLPGDALAVTIYGICLLSITAALASITYKLIEQPFIKFKPLRTNILNPLKTTGS